MQRKDKIIGNLSQFEWLKTRCFLSFLFMEPFYIAFGILAAVARKEEQILLLLMKLKVFVFISHFFVFGVDTLLLCVG